MSLRTALALALAFVMASCDSPAPVDAGPDAGAPPADAGMDGGATDAGGTDAGGTDAGETDAGGTDAGETDAGETDAGGLDAGPTDAATGDAGPFDGGPPDAGSVPDCVGPPGLYADADCVVLAANIALYEPRFELWSDDADKERFIYLPPGAQIDTSDPDRWSFPMGTRLYKTFSIGGVRLETRVFEKVAAARGLASWEMSSWEWSVDQRSVSEVSPFGALDLLGTDHDVPTRSGCIECHSVAQDDVIVGFSAIQLAHAGAGVTLQDLLDDGRLSHSIALSDTAVPGDATAQAALGYLHANCGNCHGGPAPERGLDFWIPVAPPGALEDNPAYTSAVCECSGFAATAPGGERIELRIAPGDPVLSVIAHRMGSRAQNTMMPPLATEQVDAVGLQIITNWINALPSDAGGCPTTCM